MQNNTMFNRIFILLLLCFSSFSLANHNVSYTGVSQNYSISSFTQNNIEYANIFDLKDLLGFSISKSYKYNAYVFKLNKKIVFISLDTNEVWVNNTRHFLKSKPVYKDSSLFVPFDDFLLLFDFERLYVNNTSTLAPLDLPLNLSSKLPFVYFEKKIPFKYISNIIKPTSLVYKNQSFPLLNISKSFNGKTYLNAEKLLQSIGYTITKESSEITLTYNNFEYKFDTTSRIWLAKHKDKSWKFLSSDKILIENDVVFFPINSLFSFLDYSLSFNSIDSTYELLDNIHGVSFYNTVSKKGFHLISRHKLSYSVDISKSSPFLQTLVIPFSKSFSKKIPSTFSNTQFESITLKNKYLTFEQLHSNKNYISKNNSQLLIHTTSSSSFFPQESTSGLYLSLKKTLSKVSVTKANTKYTIKLSGINIDTPKIYKENKKLIFDFHDTINSLDQLKQINDTNFRSIRSSQLSHSPLTSRFVLDFNKNIPNYSLDKSTNSLTLSFEEPKPKIQPQTIAKATSSKKVRKTKKTKSSKKKYKRSKSTRGLRNKVIILDPGHGGVDPGAVVDRSVYEKKYTLDIAKRLQKLLEKEGAYVILTRSSDSTRSLQSRVRLANKQNADLFLSIHLNSFKNSKVYGAQSFYSKSKDKKLATHIQKQITHDFKTKNLGVSRSRFFVLRHTKMPSTLLEPMFMTNANEKKQLLSASYRSKLAKSIFQGVKNYYKDS